MNTIDKKMLSESVWDEDANGKRWEDYETIVCPDGTVIDMVKLIDDQYRAMAALNHLAPFLGGFISKLRFIYSFRIPTQCTDGFNIIVNPQFTSNLDFTGKVFVMAHEVMHCLLNHMRRGKTEGLTDHEKMNIAADYEVNWTLCDIGLFKKATVENNHGYYDDKFANLGMETIYKKISGNGNGQGQMDNSGQAGQAGQNSGQQQQGGQGGQNKQQYPPDYKAGWAQAIADWKAGKIK